MTTKPDDTQQNTPVDNTKSSTLQPAKAEQARSSQYNFARAYSQRSDALTHNYYTESTLRTSFWQKLHRWFLINTFVPQWLPRGWSHPLVGYVMSVLLQFFAALSTLFLIRIFPTFAFSDLLEILSIAIIALNFGTGPSLLATLVGITLLNFFVLPQRSTSSLNDVQDFVESILFLMIGITISIVASQVERARRSAVAERTLLDAIIETVPDGVSVYDAQGRLVRMNNAGKRVEEAREIHYPTLTETTGKLCTPSGSFFRQEELPVRRALRGEVVSDIEMVWQPTTDEAQYFMVSAAPLYDALQKIAGAVSISHDTTTLRSSERATVASASELEAIFESITDGIFVFNQQGTLTRMNMAFRELLGVHSPIDSFSELPPENLGLFAVANEQHEPLSPEQWPQARILRGESVKGPTAMDIFVHTFDDREILLSVSGAPVSLHDGKLIGGVVICRDITERRRLEEYTQNALNALLAMAQTLIQGSDTAVGEQEDISSHAVGQRLVELTKRVLDCKRVGMLSVEPHTNRLLPVAVVGLTREQEYRWWDRIPTFQVADLASSTLIKCLYNGEVVQIEKEAARRDPEYAFYTPNNLLLAPMSIGNTLVGVLTLDSNNEEHVYTADEQALAGAVARLSALVIERERLLRERAEAQANEIALREANQRMNEFLSIASHELKTPITTIKGSTQLLERRLKKMIALETATVEERTRLQEEAQDLLRRTSVQVNRLTRLINDLLEVSRIQVSKLEPHMERASLATVLHDVVQEQSRGAPKRTITLDLPAHDEVWIVADIDRIEQVLTNYISNALKYSAMEEPVEVSLRIKGCDAHIAVRDSGPGLPVTERKNVFERFYRVKGIEVKSGSGVGLGLGLYICKTIIELHQGQVGVESEEGKGSTFWFSLPLAGTAE